MGLEELENYTRLKAEEKAKEDVVFFINQLKTFDPRTSRKDLDFKLYPFQEEYALWLKEKIDGGGDGFVEKSRDMGVSWVTLAVVYWLFKYKDGFQALIGSRKEDYVDDWTLSSLFPKIEYLIKNDPFPIEGYDPKKHRTYMRIINPNNGSVITGESANANFARGGRLNVVFFDELAFWPWQQPSWEGAGDSTPCRIAVTTPSTEPSYAKALRNSNIIEVKTIHWPMHPLKDTVWYAKEKERRTPDEIARELDINWEGSITGIVYPEIKYAVMDNYPYQPEWPLYVSWDFGLDGTAIGWWQKDPSFGKIRRIESYFKQDKPIHFFLPFMGLPIESINQYSQEDLDLIEIVKNYKGAVHFGDPDVEKRSYSTSNATSTRQVLSNAGIYVQTNEKANDLESRKTEVKRMLQQGIELNDTKGNRFWLEAMRGARYPKREETSQATSPNRNPIHDWTSHHRSETEYFAVNLSTITSDKQRYVTFGGGDEVTGYKPKPEYRTFKGGRNVFP